MSTLEADEPAFPVNEEAIARQLSGLSAREYAAIKLRVPESGTEWLDDMIRKSLRDDFARKTISASIGAIKEEDFDTLDRFLGEAAAFAYCMADHMLKSRDDA